jgi:hypothetical protein
VNRESTGRMGEHGALADAYGTYDILVKLLELRTVADAYATYDVLVTLLELPTATQS